jgi:hypothetical protein
MSQLTNHDRGGVRNGFADTKPQWPSTGGQRKYRSEQNLVSLDSTDGGKNAKKIPKAKLRVILILVDFVLCSWVAGSVMNLFKSVYQGKKIFVRF